MVLLLQKVAMCTINICRADSPPHATVPYFLVVDARREKAENECAPDSQLGYVDYLKSLFLFDFEARENWIQR